MRLSQECATSIALSWTVNLLTWEEKCKRKAFWANEEAQEYTVQVGEYYGTNDYAVQQIVAPDTFGRYPEDPQCDLPFRLVPLLEKQRKH